ncbi:hypothetical protein [Candidatus Enterococcus ikei]|uniref:Uncharacterized protein n=1 Tax=Candidatus Enterococcus ikei TaxID=2815326 RepID=A0ABS3H1Z9_9ENTE|nr:hypothetical protein [Enterococcus sp. DIV0869a]MBO0441528.1 hypothetical protein [Enterococcus sp. DIV0869a]
MNNRIVKMKRKVIVLLLVILIFLTGLYVGTNQLLLKHNEISTATIFPEHIRKAKDIVDVDMIDINGKNVKKDYKIKIEKQKDGKAIVTMTKKEGLNNFEGNIRYIHEDYSKWELIQNIFVNQYNDFANKINNWNYQRITGINISSGSSVYPTIFDSFDSKSVPPNIGVLLIFIGIVLFMIGLVIIYHSDKKAFYVNLNIKNLEGDTDHEL